MTLPPSRTPLLVAAPNWLGDLVMATSLLDLLAATSKLAGLPRPVLSVRRRWRPLLDGDPRLVDTVAYARGGRHAGTVGLLRQAAAWRRLDVGTAILLPPSLRAALVARLGGADRRIGFRGDGRAWLLTDPVARPPRGDLHYLEELQLLWRRWVEREAPGLAGCRVPAVPPWLPVVEQWDPAPPWRSGPPWWVVGVGATYGSAKSWPAPRAAELVADAVARGRRVVLLGDATARTTARGIAAAAGVDVHDGPGTDRPVLIDLVGATSLREAVSLVRSAELFVGNDSGLMHVAAACGTPTIGLFGSSSPAWTGPRGVRVRALAAEGFPCHPCFRRTCPEPTFCLATIGADRVLAAADALLAARAGPGTLLLDEATAGRERPTLLLDRDGVIVDDPGYLDDPEAVRFLPGAVDALREAHRAGLRLVIVTNQSGIGRGYMSESRSVAVQGRIATLLALAGVPLAAIHYCPHPPEAGCRCRKPETGLVEEAARHFPWPPGRAWVVGDRASDVQMARRAGLRPFLVLTGEGERTRRELGEVPGMRVVPDLAAAVRSIRAEVGR